MAFNLYLIRHGESEVNIQPDIMGQLPDTKLTEYGRYQADCLRRKLVHSYFDYVFSSTCIRALDTAKIVFPESKIITVPELVEYDAGDWTECSRSKTVTKDILLRMGYMNMGFKPPGGESQNMVERRASKWLEEEILYNKDKLEYLYGLDKPLGIAVFSHGVTIKSLLHYVMGFDKSFTWKIEIDNTSITELSFGDKGWRLHCINDTSHLG